MTWTSLPWQLGPARVVGNWQRGNSPPTKTARGLTKHRFMGMCLWVWLKVGSWKIMQHLNHQFGLPKEWIRNKNTPPTTDVEPILGGCNLRFSNIPPQASCILCAFSQTSSWFALACVTSFFQRSSGKTTCFLQKTQRKREGAKESNKWFWCNRSQFCPSYTALSSLSIPQCSITTTQTLGTRLDHTCAN